MGSGRGAQAHENVLTPVEAAQAQALIRAATEKLSLASVITVDADEQAAELSRSVGDEISRVILEQKQLEQRFEALISQRGLLKAMPNKTKYKENQKELHDVAEQLRNSTKVLCRNLKENPNVAGNMLKIQTERMQLQTLLSTAIVELEDCAHDTLNSTVHEEEARERAVASTVEREKTATAAVKQLQVQLKEEKASHDDDMGQKKQVLGVLKDQLKGLKTTTTDDFKYKERFYNADNQCERRVQTNLIVGLEGEIERLRNLINIERQVHGASAEFLATKAHGLSDEANSWSSRLDADVKAKDAELEQLKVAHQRDFFKVKEMKEKVQVELADRELRLADERRLHEAEKGAVLEQEHMHRAATKIQALFRGYRVRLELNPGLKKAGGGKAAKKGKKGK